MDGIEKCLNCGVKISGAGVDTKAAQSAVDQVVSSCKAAGSPVKSITISSKQGSGARLTVVMNVGLLAVVALGSALALA
jgi:ribosome-binding protein aMBF1 (putative translation factor)